MREVATENVVRNPGIRTVAMVLAMRRRADLEGMSCLIEQEPTLELLSAHESLPEAAGACGRARVDVVILDASYPEFQAFAVGEKLLSSGRAKSAIFIDDEFRLARAELAWQLYGAQYFTRHSGFALVYQGIRDVLQSRDDEVSQLKLVPKHRFLADAKAHVNESMLAYCSLTDRERQIVRLLANGLTGREVAVQLKLSSSTVDNHKVRAMKKLSLNKLTQLTQLAMRIGLID